MENTSFEVLQRSRAELVSDLRAIERMRMSLFKRLARLEAELEAAGGRVHRRPREVHLRRQIFRRGELSRLVATALRDLGPHMTNRDLATLVLDRVGVRNSTNRAIGELAGKVRAVRRRLTAANIPSTGG